MSEVYATGAALHITVFIEDSNLLGLMSAGARFREACQQENEKWLKTVDSTGRRNTTKFCVSRRSVADEAFLVTAQASSYAK